MGADAQATNTGGWPASGINICVKATEQWPRGHEGHEGHIEDMRVLRVI